MKFNYDVYLIDFDGTLVDSFDSLARVFKGAYKAVGVDIPDCDLRMLTRIRLEDGYTKYNAPLDKTDIFANTLLTLLNDDTTIRLTKNFSDVKQLLETLKKEGKIIGIVTSNNVPHVGLVLDHLNIDKNYFSVIVGNEDTVEHKPSPDPILKALEKLNITNEKVCYIGDGLDDMKSAKSAGIDSILISRFNEYTNENDKIIRSLSEL